MFNSRYYLFGCEEMNCRGVRVKRNKAGMESRLTKLMVSFAVVV